MCGVIGLMEPNKDGVAMDLARGLFAIQHRGQDSCGIATRTGDGALHMIKGVGLVKQVFDQNRLQELPGQVGIGHVRYPTAGRPTRENAQPHLIDGHGGQLVLCSNGDIIDIDSHRQDLQSDGAEFYGQNDGEVLARFLHREIFQRDKSPLEAIRILQDTIKGAYSACTLVGDRLYAFRDRHGFRPLQVAFTDTGGVVFSSESVIPDILRAQNPAEVEPGDIVEVDPSGRATFHRCPENDREPFASHCSFELIYFARPDAQQFGHRVFHFRETVGRYLAEKDDVEADLVVPVPDSSNYIALGYARQSGIPFELGLVRNHYVGRTFIKPDQGARDEGVKEKFNPLPGLLKDQRIILVDDSIVRGTTLRKLVRMLKGNGAKEVHVRIGSPPVTGPCPYGIDTPTREQLIASRMDLEQIREHLTADSLMYLDIMDLKKSLGDHFRFCMACFDNTYPIPWEKSSKAEAEKASDEA